MKIVNFIVYALVKTVLWFGRWTPMGPTIWWLRGLARLFYPLMKKRRALMLWNLEYALGRETTPEQREEIARQSFENLFIAFGELIHMEKIMAHWREHFRFTGDEIVDRYLKAKRGFFVFGGHFGGWTMPASFAMRFPDAAGYNMVARPLRNPKMQALLEYMAKKFGGSIITTRGAGSRIEDAVARGEMVGFYMDQESRRDQGIFVKFFGRDASSHVVPGYLAWKNQIPLIPYWIPRERPGYFHVIFREPLTIAVTEDKDENNRRMTQLIADEVERAIKEYPDQWLWAHNRWRRLPEGTKIPLFEKEKKKHRTKARAKGEYLSSEDQVKKTGTKA